MNQNFLVSSGSKPKTRSAESAAWFGSCFGEQTKDDTHLRKILYVRVLLIGTLFAAAAVVSTISHVILRDNEQNKFESQYNSVSASALQSVADTFSRNSIGLRDMASTYSYIYPNATSYPEVAWLGFQKTANLLSNLTVVSNIGFVPIVKPSELASYQAYMYRYYRADPSIDTSSMGIVWSLTDGLLPVVDPSGGVQPDSPYVYYAPVSQITYSRDFGDAFYAFNLRSIPLFNQVLDQIMIANLKDNDFSIGVSVPFGAFDLSAGVSTSQSKANGTKVREGTAFALGGTYALSKRTRVYAAYLDGDTENAAGTTVTERKLYAVGVAHTF